MTSSLPIISLSSPTLARDILQVLSPSASASADPAAGPRGFFYLVDHSIPPRLLSGAFRASRTFFEDESSEEKRRTIDRKGHTGWTGVGEESLDPTRSVAGGMGDVKESFYLSLALLPSPPSPHCAPQLLPPTLAPSSSSSPHAGGGENHSSLVGLLTHSRRICASLLAAFEHALALPAGTFGDRHLGGEDDRLRLIRYPAQRPFDSGDGDGGDGGDGGGGVDSSSRRGIRAGAHSDYGSLTLLAQSDIGGLQVLARSAGEGEGQGEEERWIDVPPRQGALVVNVGDCLEFWSRGLLPSTVHRVVEPRGEEEREARYSIAYFHHPSPDSSLSPLSPSLLPPELVERLPPLQEWRRKCLKKGIPEEALPRDESEGNAQHAHAMTGGEYLKRRLKASGL